MINWKGRQILLDDEDRHHVDGRTVYIDTHGYVKVEWGGRRASGGQRAYLHRLIMNPPKGATVDHRDHNPLDNRKDNLRIATRSQQNMNRRLQKKHRTGFKGVWPTKSGFSAMIKKDDKRVYLGHFQTAEAAARAYDDMARELFGEFAHLNTP